MSFSPYNAVFLLVCFLVVLCALVSGSIYPASAELAVLIVIAGFFISLAGGASPALAALWPAWLFAGLACMSGIWTINLNATLAQGFFFTGFALLSYLVAYSAGSDGRAVTLLRAVVLVSAVISVYGIYQYAAGFARTEDYVRAYGASELGFGPGRVASALTTLGFRRAFSTLFSPNALACYLAMAAPSGLHLAIRAASRAKRVSYLALLALMLGALALTKSVGGIAAMFAGMLVYSVAAYAAGMLRIRVAAVILSAMVVLAVLAGGMALTKRGGGFGGVGRSFEERLSYFKGALGSFYEAPLKGSGAGSFSVTYFASIGPGGDETRYAHNLPLQTLSETGIAGLLALVVLFGSFFARCWSGVRQNPSGGVYPAVIAGGAAFIVHNMVDFTFYVFDTAVLFWVYFGLAASGTVSQYEITDKRMRAGIKAVAALGVSVFCCFFVLSALARDYETRAVDILKAYGISSSGEARSNPVPDEAVSMAEKAVSMKPYDDSYQAFLGYLYEGAAYANGPGYALKALEAHKKAVSLNPMYPFHYRDLGILYMKLGRRADARDCFREASRLYPASGALAELLANSEK